MLSKQKYDNTFINCLSLSQDDLTNDLTYQSLPAWDSVAHMSLVADIESEFDIMLDTDDIIDFSSYQKGKEILAKYGIEII